jgi:hypothetical protein
MPENPTPADDAPSPDRRGRASARSGQGKQARRRAPRASRRENPTSHEPASDSVVARASDVHHAKSEDETTKLSLVIAVLGIAAFAWLGSGDAGSAGVHSGPNTEQPSESPVVEAAALGRAAPDEVGDERDELEAVPHPDEATEEFDAEQAAIERALEIEVDEPIAEPAPEPAGAAQAAVAPPSDVEPAPSVPETAPAAPPRKASPEPAPAAPSQPESPREARAEPPAVAPAPNKRPLELPRPGPAPAPPESDNPY